MSVIVALIAVYFAFRAYNTTAKLEHDWSTYYLSSLDARTGENPYRDRTVQSPFIYPPMLLWLVTPLTYMDPQVGAIFWAWLTMFAWVAVVWLTNDALQRLWPPAKGENRAWLLWVPTLLAFRPIWRELGIGQVNLIVLSLVTAAFWSLVRRRDGTAGALIALAADIKILPITFLLPLAMWKRWRALGVALVMLPGWLLLPALTYGPSRYAEICSGFLHGRLFTHAVSLAMDNHSANQSLPATVNRFLSAENGLPPQHKLANLHVNVASLPLQDIAVVLALIGLVLAAATAFALWRSRSRPELAGAGFALVWLTTHLMSKKTWEEHLVTLLFVYTALLYGSPAYRKAGTSVVVVAAALNWFYTPLLWGRPMADVVQAYGPTTLALLVLWAHLFRRLSVAEPQPATAAALETDRAEPEPSLA